RTADLWVRLMHGLGYDRFFAQGGDWGASVSEQLGHRYPEIVRGIHITMGLPAPLDVYAGERPWQVAIPRKFASHVAVQMLEPQTLAWALHDSPVGMLAWLAEHRRLWGDCDGDVERRFSKDHLITTTMLYWATGAFSSSIRFYAEAAANPW